MPAAQPVLVLTSTIQPWSNTTDPALDGGIDALAGDKILVIGVSADSATAGDLTLTGGTGLTWAETSDTTASRCGVHVWTTSVGSDQTVMLSLDRQTTIGNFSARYWVIRGSDGFGTPVIDATGPASLALSTTQDESTIIALTADWIAQNSSVTWTAISTATESSPDDNAWTSGEYTIHSRVFAGIDTAGVKTVANSLSGSTNTLIAIEVKGTTTGGVSAPPSGVLYAGIEHTIWTTSGPLALAQAGALA